MSAAQLFYALTDAKLVGATGRTVFELNGIKTPINDPSVVGNIIQEWLGAFMQQHKIAYREQPNTQEFPDFYLHPNRNDTDLLEVKCFHSSPNFDIANFLAYCESLTTAPYRLDADYLLIEYEPTPAGVTIKQI
jgi:NgoBV restriction endonuclease